MVSLRHLGEVHDEIRTRDQLVSDARGRGEQRLQFRIQYRRGEG